MSDKKGYEPAIDLAMKEEKFERKYKEICENAKRVLAKSATVGSHHSIFFKKASLIQTELIAARKIGFSPRLARELLEQELDILKDRKEKKNSKTVRKLLEELISQGDSEGMATIVENLPRIPTACLVDLRRDYFKILRPTEESIGLLKRINNALMGWDASISQTYKNPYGLGSRKYYFKVCHQDKINEFNAKNNPAEHSDVDAPSLRREY